MPKLLRRVAVVPSIYGESAMKVAIPLDFTHIVRGEKATPYRCALALAMSESGLKEPSVLPDLAAIYYSDAEGQRWKAKPNKACKAWIRSYDAGDSVEPAVIELKGKRLGPCSTDRQI